MNRISGLPPTVAKERAAESLRHVGLHEERYRLIGTYSTGMKQRVKLAQALVGAPQLLLLDEPTNGLDPAGRTAMLELIGRIGTEFGISIVVASHLLGEIERICDHLVAIDSGRLLRADSMTSFTQASQVLAVEVEEGLAQLQAELASRGLAATLAGSTATGGAMGGTAQARTLLVPLGGDDTYDVVRDCVAALALPLCRLEQRRHPVEELFRDEQEVGNPLAKFLALTAALLILIETPLLILYVGTIASAKGGAAIWAETRALIPGLGVGLMWAVLFAAIGLVLASFTGRRAYLTGIVAITCILTFFLSLLLIQAEGGQTGIGSTSTGARVAGLFSPFTILDGVRVWLGGNPQTGLVANPGRYGPLYGVLAVVLLAACLGGLAARYRRVSQS